MNPRLGVGKIAKKLQIPASRELDKEDTFFITRFKVIFKNGVEKIVDPVDLVHYLFEENDRVVTNVGVATVNSNAFSIRRGEIAYELLYPNGKLSQVPELEIASKFEVSLREIVSKKKASPLEQFLLKYWANQFLSYYASYQIKCITNSRLSLMPHQINVAHRLSEEHFPRAILADEVGLGKTIEAGIFIKEMMARNLAERALIVVPASLVRQWHFEMQNKFNMEFVVYDSKKVKELKTKGNYKFQEPIQNPFFYDKLIICSLQFARNKKYAELISQVFWDIAIFDEAHHLRRYLANAATENFNETLNYSLAKAVSQNCESLLLLTATPIQLHSFELYSLNALIHPEAFANFSDFEHFRKNLPFINLAITNINQIDKLNKFEVENTIDLLKKLNYIDVDLSKERAIKSLKSSSYNTQLTKRLENDHTLSKYLIRNRKRNVFEKEFLSKRVVNTILVNPKKEELDLYNEIRLYLAKIYNLSMSDGNAGLGFVISTLQKLLTSSKHAICKSIERRLEQIKKLKLLSSKNHESILLDEYNDLEVEDEDLDSDTYEDSNGDFEAGGHPLVLDLVNQEKILKEFFNKLQALPYDSKADNLIELLRTVRNQDTKEKVLLFTQFVDTLFYLKEMLQKEGIFVELFYGGLDKAEKDEAVERFRKSEAFSVLLSTEVGGEGRNFQFCRVLVNYDLPWNPMKLEQRIGRVDRLGQKSKEIYIYNFFLEGTIEADIVFALNKRINLFEESISELEPILGNIEKEIRDIVFSEEKDKRKKLNEFNRSLEEELKKNKELEMQLDDLVIDKKSFRMDGLITTLACEEVKLSHNELFLFVNQFLSLKSPQYGSMVLASNDIGEKDTNSFYENEVKIRLDSNFLANLEENLNNEYVGTFNLDLARERESIDFLALGHPLIDTMLKFCASTEFPGEFTVMAVRKDAISEKMKRRFEPSNELYLFVFQIKFQGFIVETEISAIITDERGNEVEGLADHLLNIKNCREFVSFEETHQNSEFNANIIDQLSQRAKSLAKKKVSNWKGEIRKLNEKIFGVEQTKRENLYIFNKKALSAKREVLSQKLNKKVQSRPTEKQHQNISKIEDPEKKKERLERIQQLEEEIAFIQKDLTKIDKKMDDLSFAYEDKLNDLKKRNIAKFYTNLQSVAVIKLVDKHV